MKSKRFYRQKCWSTMMEPPEELDDKSGDYEEEHDDMEEECYQEIQPYHYAELERIRGIKDVGF